MGNVMQFAVDVKEMFAFDGSAGYIHSHVNGYLGGEAMTTIYSIAEARNQFAALIREVEEGDEPVQVTRRGEPVAVILSRDKYEQLLAQQSRLDFWQAYQAWRQKWQVDTWEDEADPFAGIRDHSPGRRVVLWE